MLSWVAKLLLTSTAIAPVLVTYAWVAWRAGETRTSVVLLMLCALLIIVCRWVLGYAKRHLERLKFRPTTVEAADRENMGFLLIYLLPLFTAEFTTLNWQIWAPAIAIFAAVVATGYSYHFNPLLGLLGWHFYRVGTEQGVTFVLITRKHLRNAQETLKVGQLTEYIVIDLGD